MKALFRKIRLSVQMLYSWRQPTSENLMSAQCVCGQAFGFRGPKDVDEELRIPGTSNEQMGSIVRNLVDQLEIPFSIQGEIAKSEAMIPLISDTGDFRTTEQQVIYHNPEGGYVSCYTIETLTWAWMKENNWSKVVIVTHPLLIWRMKMVMERLAAEDNLPLEVLIPSGLSSIGWDKQSAQWRTHNVFCWICYEMMARIHHIWKAGWI